MHSREVDSWEVEMKTSETAWNSVKQRETVWNPQLDPAPSFNELRNHEIIAGTPTASLTVFTQLICTKLNPVKRVDSNPWENTQDIIKHNHACQDSLVYLGQMVFHAYFLMISVLCGFSKLWEVWVFTNSGETATPNLEVRFIRRGRSLETEGAWKVGLKLNVF